MHEGKNVDAVSSPLARDLADRRELLHAGEAGRHRALPARVSALPEGRYFIVIFQRIKSDQLA
jgi:hypothetical protein